jgi:hypothetical protein
MKSFLFAMMASAIAHPGAAAQTVDSPQYLSWARAEKGASITMRSTTTRGGDPRPITSTITYVLTDLTPEKATLEMSVVSDATGTKVENPPQELVIRKAFPLLPGIRPEDVGRPRDAVEKGDETLKLAGREFRARWYVTKGQTEAGRSQTRTWLCDDVPGLLLKSVTTVPKVDTTVTLELIEFRRKQR